MADSLKDRGWNTMRSVLDKELPVTSRRPDFLLILVLILFVAGLILGWYGRILWNVRQADPVQEDSKSVAVNISDVRTGEEEDQLISMYRTEKNNHIPSAEANDKESVFAPVPVTRYLNLNLLSNNRSNVDRELSSMSGETFVGTAREYIGKEASIQEFYSSDVNHDYFDSAKEKTISSDRIETLLYDVLVFPQPQLSGINNVIRSSSAKQAIRADLELIIDFGILSGSHQLSPGFQANLILHKNRRLNLVAGAGYRYLALDRDYSFRNNGVSVIEPEIRPLSKGTVFYIQDISQVHLNVGLEYRFHDLVSLRGGVMPSLNKVSGTFLENHPQLSGNSGSNYFSMDYNISMQVRILPKINAYINYNRNMKSFTDVEPDQGRRHNFYGRYAIGLSWRL